MKWYLKCLKQYATFSGRARRKEYWLFVLFNILFSILAVIVDTIIMASAGFYLPIFTLLYSFFIIIPSWAVLVRRLHDTGKSGWMIFIALIPIIGSIWLLVLMFTDSQPGTNKYGENPKEIAQ